nr:methyltransferase/helicase [Beet pseudoyellows virus]
MPSINRTITGTELSNNLSLKGKITVFPLDPSIEEKFNFLKEKNFNLKKVFCAHRLQVLVDHFNLHGCSFKRMPVPLRNAFGYDFLKINQFIDQKLSVKIGMETIKNTSVLEDITGKTGFSDGYLVRKYEDRRHADVFISFGRYFKYDHDIMFRLTFAKTHNRRRLRTIVETSLGRMEDRGEVYLKPFTLFDRLPPKAFEMQCLLLSVIERCDDMCEIVNYYKNTKFSQPVKKIREKFYRRCTVTMIGVNQSRPPVQMVPRMTPVKPTFKVTPYASTQHIIRDDGEEEFVVRLRSGKVIVVRNDRRAVANLFNATLGEGTYKVHSEAFTPNGKRFKHYKRAYCWLDAFLLARKKIPLETVPHPCLSYGYLLRCGLEKVMRGRITMVSATHGHFTVERVTETRNARRDTYVGVRWDDGAEVSLKNISNVFDDICSGILSQTTLRAENDVMTNIVRRVSDKINSVNSMEKELTINVCLSSSQKKKLCVLFPELNFDFSETSYSSHALFTAMRQCENYVMAKRMGFSNFIDAGGDIVSVLHKKLNNVHVCSPLVDVKDAHRHMTRSNQIDNMIGLSETATLCNDKCQDCKVERQNIVAVEVYDMTLHDMAKSLLSHKSKRFDFTVIIPPEVCEPECDVRLFDDSLRVHSDGNTVTYFYGDCGESYAHDAQTLRDILRMQIFSVDGVVFKKTLECSKEALHFFSLVPCVGMPPGRLTFSSYYSRSEQDKVLMVIPSRDKFGGISNVKVKVDKSIVYHLLEYVMNTALRVDDKAIEYLISQFRARKSISIKGGKVIQTPFELPLDLYPGFLGVILGEGIRLREKTHYIARMSYYRHYLPTIINIMIAFMNRTFTKARQFCYESIVDMFRYVMGDSFINDAVNGDKRIFDIMEVYDFRQTVNIVGDGQKRNVINESFQKFLNESKENLRTLDDKFCELDEMFTDSESDKLKDLVLSGGGASNQYVFISFDLYKRIHGFVSRLVSKKSLVDKLVVMISKVITYLLNKFKKMSQSVVTIISDVIRAIIDYIRTGNSRLLKVFKTAGERVTGKISDVNNSWMDELEKVLDDEDQLISRSEIETVDNSDQIDDIRPEGVEMSVIQSAENIVLAGGGAHSFNLQTLLKLFPISGVFRIKSTWKSLIVSVRSFLKRIAELYHDVKEVPGLILDFVKAGLSVVKDYVTSTEGLETLIQNTSLTITNLIVSIFTGNVGMLGIMLSNFLFLGLKIFGIEKKYLGCNTVTAQVANVFLPPTYFGPLAFPIRGLLSKVVETKLKMKCSKISQLKPAATDLIAKDVTLIRFYDKFSPSALRVCIYISIIFVLFSPRLMLTLGMCCLLIGEMKKFLSTTVLQTNISLSYASVLKKTQKSQRMKRFKSILAEKFLRSKTDNQQSNDDEPQMIAGSQIDSDVDVEFDYDGSYVEKSKPTQPLVQERKMKDKLVTGNWADVSDSSSVGSIMEFLNYSNLRESTDRRFLKCDVTFGLSDIILKYPISSLQVCVTGADSRINALAEYYYLESQKLCIEMGKLDNLARMFNSKTSETKCFKDTVWDLRNNLDDSTLYISENGDAWYRLKRGDLKKTKLEGVSKMTLDQSLINFDRSHKGVQFTSEELLGMYTNNRCLGLEKFIDKTTGFKVEPSTEKIKFFNKPPGAGKTTTIVNSLVKDLSSRTTCLSLTCTNAGRKEIVSKLKARGVTSPHLYAMTYDSLLMKGKEFTVTNLYCDEIFMVHCGEWFACLNLIKCQSIECFGDKNQIPYINRVPNTVCHHSYSEYMTFPIEYDNISYRCPPDVCYILSSLTDPVGNPLYPGGVYSAGSNCDNLRSLSVEPMNSPDEIKFRDEDKHITFTQPEKEEVSRAISKQLKDSKSANTVNEVQGGTFPAVMLFRNKQFDNPLYSDVNQFIVSISRHTDRMCYKTISSKLNDYVGEKISALNTVADYIIKEYKFKRRV